MSGRRSDRGVTARAVGIGLVGSAAVTLWVHQAEIVLGSGAGHTALANTSIPVGAFAGLLALVGANAVLRGSLSALTLSRGELITAYVMMTSSTVLASSGGIHFLIPTLAAAFYFATPANHWDVFQQYIPTWFAPRDRAVLDAFYVGDSTVPVHAWLTPFAAWGGFFFALAFATVCLSSILRRQWVDHERLAFPTVVVPLELTDEQQPLLRNRLVWLGCALPFIVQMFNNLHLNYPDIPGISLRDMEIPVYTLPFPLNSMDYTPVNFFPFVVGIAYLLSLEVTFSYWFFYVLTKVQLVAAAAAGWRLPGMPLDAAVPYLSYQGAGAFLAIPLISLWLARDYLMLVVRSVIGLRGGIGEEGKEPLPYRSAAAGFLGSLCAMILFCRAAGMNTYLASLLLGISLLYILAATRIRAETGTAWLFGPEVDPNTLVTTTFGSSYLRPADLTIMAYLRFATSFDLRCLSMPHQLDGFRMAGAARLNMRRLLLAILAAIVVVISVGFWAALAIWYRLGAAAKADWWRTQMGEQPFISLSSYLQTPPVADAGGIAFTALGLVFTCFLAVMRARYVWWPFHPVGYAMANTAIWGQLPFPFFIAWATKLLVLRYGGIRLYRRSLPFFLGVIVGDLAGGAFFTLLGGIVRMNVYPVNW